MPRSSPDSIAAVVLLAVGLCSGCQSWRVDPWTFDERLSPEMVDALRLQLNHDSWRPNSKWTLLDAAPPSGATRNRPDVFRWQLGSPLVDDVISQLNSVKAVQESEAPAMSEESRTGDPPLKSAGADSSEVGSTAAEAASAENEAGRPSGSKSSGRSEARWNGFWPLNVAEVLDALDERAESSSSPNQATIELGTQYLVELAGEEGLSGWNAAILLARRDPAAALPFLPVLKRIASSIPERNGSSPDSSSPAGHDDDRAADEHTPEFTNRGTVTESPQMLLDRLVDQLRSDAEESQLDGRDRQAEQDGLSRPAELLRRILAPPGRDAGGPRSAEFTPKPAQISDSMRAAAAEAWCRVLAAGSGDPLEALAPAGRLLERADLPNAVRAELFRGLARHIPPSRIPRLSNALRVSTDGQRVPLEVRRAAIDGCLIHALHDASFDQLGREAQGRTQRRPLTIGTLGRCRGAEVQRGKGAEVQRGRGAKGQRFKDPSFVPLSLCPSAPLNLCPSAPLPLYPYDPSLWPTTVLNGQSDPDPLVRRTFGRWLAIVKYRGEHQPAGPSALRAAPVGGLRATDAFSILEAQLHDREPRVRDDALLSLGLLGTEPARLELGRQAQRPEEMVRAAAVRGLAHWGIDEFAFLVRDPSFVVRQSVAEQLARFPSARAGLLLRDLLTDRDLKVQLAVVDNVADWPDALALPLLLEGLRAGSRPTRRAAFGQLRRRRKISDTFPLFDSVHQDERNRAVIDLAARLDVPLGYLDRLGAEQAERRSRPDAVRIGDIEADLRLVTDPESAVDSPRFAEALSRLRQLNASDVPIVEDFLLRSREPDSESPARTGVLFREVLPAVSPAYAALADLEHNDLRLRRRAASRLRELSAERSLSRLVIRRLAGHLNHRQDTLVWRDAIAAVMPDAADENGQIALRALNDERPEIRLLGCDYVLRHPRPAYGGWLIRLKLIDDPDKRVRLAAIEAAGHCGNPRVLDDIVDAGPAADDVHGTVRPAASDSVAGTDGERLKTPGLRSLLTDSDPDIRVAAVISMCHLGDPAAIEELVRLSWNPDWGLRARAVRAMGETGNTRFIEALIRRGWTEQNAEARRAVLSSLDRLTLPGKRPAGLVDLASYDAKIRKWLDWWERKQRPPAAETAVGQ